MSRSRFGADGQGERGGIMPFILMLLPVLLGFVGLAYDGGVILAEHRHATNVAAAAARAGTNDLDEASVYAGDPVMAPTAEATARSFALAQGANTALARRIEPDVLEVEATMRVDLLFLGVIGLGSQTVTGVADSKVEQQA